ncbi:transglycosylase family protein [Streptomyces sp. PTD5-9]|uniref:transglycosylase family protein n=1 Tax=Streptomyces sp. PTD5-9 TaxID=3120150 RepID=UPI003008F172
MGSANGRHRRPRQAPAIVVAAGVTGSAIALPLLGAGAAQAADSVTWDRVAECESGGSWSADFGNGSYGGLQFTPELWKAYGGEAYAPRADLASRAQQIAVAEKVLADRGPKAWPSCATLSGLAVNGAQPGVDPGAAPSGGASKGAGTEKDAGPADDASQKHGKASGEASAPPSGESATPSDGAAGADAGTGTAEESPSGESATPPSDTHRSPESGDMTDSLTPSAPSGESDEASGAGGRHRGAPAAEEGRGDSDGGLDRESGRHASRGEGGARDAAAPAADDAYTVRPGDNLWAIADAQKVPGGWPALYDANKDVVGDDPDLILPGQSLDLGVNAD